MYGDRVNYFFYKGFIHKNAYLTTKLLMNTRYLEMMMKAMIIDKYGKVPLRLVEVPLPEIGEYEVLIEIHAAGINPLDFRIRSEEHTSELQSRGHLVCRLLLGTKRC